MKKRILSVTLCLMVFLMTTIPCFALDDSVQEITPRFSSIAFTAENAWYEDNEICALAAVQTYTNTDIKITFKFESTNGNGWKTIKTVSKQIKSDWIEYKYTIPCTKGESYRITIQYNVGTDKPRKVKYVNT